MVHLHCLRSRVYELFLLIEQFHLPLMINSVKITGSSLENKNKILFFYTYTRLYIYIYIINIIIIIIFILIIKIIRKSEMRYTNFILFKKIKIRENLKIKNSFQIEIESEKDAQKNFLFFF